MVGKNKVLIPFVLEPFFCCLEETALFVGFALSDGEVRLDQRHVASLALSL